MKAIPSKGFREVADMYTILAFHIASVRKLALISKGETFPLNLKPNYAHEFLSLF
jgi:hypothetical protein